MENSDQTEIYKTAMLSLVLELKVVVDRKYSINPNMTCSNSFRYPNQKVVPVCVKKKQRHRIKISAVG